MSAPKIEFKTSIGWRVLSASTIAQGNGYWTGHHSKKEALKFAASMETGRAYEVRDEFMYEDNKIVAHVSEKWKLLK